MNKEEIVAFQEKQKKIIVKAKKHSFVTDDFPDSICLDARFGHDYIVFPKARVEGKNLTVPRICKTCGYKSTVEYMIEIPDFVENTISINDQRHYAYATPEEMERL